MRTAFATLSSEQPTHSTQTPPALVKVAVTLAATTLAGRSNTAVDPPLVGSTVMALGSRRIEAGDELTVV